MSLEFLTLTVNYEVKTDKFVITGDLNEKGRYEIIENFLREQIGAGVDKSPYNNKDKYTIKLTWYPSDDRINATDNIGNKDLRDGLLMEVLRRREK